MLLLQIHVVGDNVCNEQHVPWSSSLPPADFTCVAAQQTSGWQLPALKHCDKKAVCTILFWVCMQDKTYHLWHTQQVLVGDQFTWFVTHSHYKWEMLLTNWWIILKFMSTSCNVKSMAERLWCWLLLAVEVWYAKKQQDDKVSHQFWWGADGQATGATLCEARQEMGLSAQSLMLEQQVKLPWPQAHSPFHASSMWSIPAAQASAASKHAAVPLSAHKEQQSADTRAVQTTKMCLICVVHHKTLGGTWAITSVYWLRVWPVLVKLIDLLYLPCNRCEPCNCCESCIATWGLWQQTSCKRPCYLE